ncbi:DUF5693 family protein [Cohnella nanjingensis]|uniref:DUF5693 family protein n=1 Tax=Cohnella nanjingensis TaxID=1387779 RepID=UPI0028A7ED5C|nr:DUF5693 family protein [Cohnella nanjingensis]
MPQWLEQWNRRLAKWLWWVVLVGVIGSLPVMYARVQTENSADKVEIVMNYKAILQVSTSQPNPAAFVQTQMNNLKEAGVNAMAVFESSLEELSWAGEVTVYNAGQAALLDGKLSEPGDNRTYVLFNNAADEPTLRPIIEAAFKQLEVPVTSWSAQGRAGLRIDMSPDDAYIRPMQPNPLAMKAIRDAGFLVVPRLSDRILPYDSTRMKAWLESFKTYGATRIIFDGEAVPGFNDQDEEKSLDDFAKQLKEYGIGIAAIENLKVPQKGLGTLAKEIGYNVVRLHSVSDIEMSQAKVPVLTDRFVLAVKDRNIRMIYLNAIQVKDPIRLQVTHPFDTIVKSLAGDEDNNEDGAIARMKDFGFVIGEAHPFDIHHAPAEKALRALTIAGAVSLIALTVGLFLPSILTPITILGFIGGAGVWVLNSSTLTQALALFVAIAAPTASVVTLIRLLRARRNQPESFRRSAGARLGSATILYVRTAVLSVAAVPFVIALLNDITYMLVLQQFRGVSLLHLAPIALVAVYLFLYGPGATVWGNARRILNLPITVLWVVAAVVLGAAGMYYLSRTGNAGQATGIELQLRSILETTFHVRPRFKEFVLGHPLMLLGLFLALRYPKWPLLLIAAATIGQLSMVDTFAHIHTPSILSATRDALGLAIGFVFGLIAIAVWQVLASIWYKSRGGAKARV